MDEVLKVALTRQPTPLPRKAGGRHISASDWRRWRSPRVRHELEVEEFRVGGKPGRFRISPPSRNSSTRAKTLLQ
jgi:hypothetical protein